VSILGKILNPVYQAVSGLLALYYSWIPNYAVAISLLTLTVMVIAVPLTVKSTRSMLAMQRLSPKMKEIQKKYKDDRITQQQEMSALFKEHGVSPASGCLPMLLQLPIFLVLYEVVRGLTNLDRAHQPAPKYIGHETLLYRHLVAAHGTMVSFGIDLARSATSVHGGLVAALPYYGLVALTMILGYWQYQQMTNRVPQANAANPAAQYQKFIPLVFGVIYISFPAAVTIYFLVSNVFRIAQQSFMYRFDPKVREHVGSLRRTASAPPVAAALNGSGADVVGSKGAAGDGRGSSKADRSATAKSAAGSSRGAPRSRPQQSGNGKGAVPRTATNGKGTTDRAGSASRPSSPGVPADPVSKTAATSVTTSGRPPTNGTRSRSQRGGSGGTPPSASGVKRPEPVPGPPRRSRRGR
jgi:YidC/Oxa1 family membrane protein insertase